MRFSIIIPVYNRPDELDELLAGLAVQEGVHDFEAVIVEDGSVRKSDEVVARYGQRIPIRYIVVPNGGPARARNIGASCAQGDYLLILDSDVVLPKGFLNAVEAGLRTDPCDAWGGPDAAGEGFDAIQRAISYTMTSFLTTGGIRGGKKSMEKFKPRSFNLGCKREVYEALGGFTESMRFGEDIDFSLRLFAKGYRVRLYPECFVYHKRRVSLKSFFKQVHNSGRARIDLGLRHPGSTKAVHWLPAVFTLGMAATVLLAFFFWWAWLIPLAFSIIILLDALRSTASLRVALRAVPAAWIQLTGYGSGFLYAFIRMRLMSKGMRNAFEKTFYD